MPLSLSTIAIEEKNQLATDSVFLVCLSITIPGVADPIRVVRNNEDLSWQGHTWQAFPFELDEIGDTATGEVPQINVKVSNVSRAMELYVQAYDAWCKVNGYSPVTVSIYVVNTKAVTADPNCAPEVSHLFDLRQPKTDSRWVTFVLGASNPFSRRFPQGRILKSHCRYAFKDTRCGYSGPTVTCDHTLAACRGLDNSERFGGFPGAGYGGVTVAVA